MFRVSSATENIPRIIVEHRKIAIVSHGMISRSEADVAEYQEATHGLRDLTRPVVKLFSSPWPKTDRAEVIGSECPGYRLPDECRSHRSVTDGCTEFCHIL